jgi:hypothetical protein
VAAGGELPPERYRGEGVAGVAEGGEQETAALAAQTISASWRTIRFRSSGSNATGTVIRVPTPASR